MCSDVVVYGIHPSIPLFVARGDHVECSGATVRVGDGYRLTSEGFSHSLLREEVLQRREREREGGEGGRGRERGRESFKYELYYFFILTVREEAKLSGLCTPKQRTYKMSTNQSNLL